MSATPMTEVTGDVSPGFEGVRDAFEANFSRGLEVGAGLCVHVDGRKVVDLCGGAFDEGGERRPYGPDALQFVFSSTKGATAACAHLLAQRGLLDFDEPVATYWPEFAQAGKGDLPVRYLLSHQAGLPVVDRALTTSEFLAWDPIVAALAEQAPQWEPGTATDTTRCPTGIWSARWCGGLAVGPSGRSSPTRSPGRSAWSSTSGSLVSSRTGFPRSLVDRS